MELAGNKLLLQPAGPLDKAFLISTWVRSYQPISRKIRVSFGRNQLGVADGLYLLHHTKIVEDLWPFSTVAKDAEDAGGAVVAYVCGGPGVLHYVYVVPELRRMGLASTMVASVCGKQPMVTHVWPYKIPANWTWNPYLLGGQHGC